MTGRLRGLGQEARILRARMKRDTGPIPVPDQLIAELHNIPFTAGESVYDSVTGAEVQVVQFGVENADPDSAITQD